MTHPSCHKHPDVFLAHAPGQPTALYCQRCVAEAFPGTPSSNESHETLMIYATTERSGPTGPKEKGPMAVASLKAKSGELHLLIAEGDVFFTVKITVAYSPGRV
jgi:hypothetical protein